MFFVSSSFFFLGGRFETWFPSWGFVYVLFFCFGMNFLVGFQLELETSWGFSRRETVLEAMDRNEGCHFKDGDGLRSLNQAFLA